MKTIDSNRRLYPCLLDYDYLILKSLRNSIQKHAVFIEGDLIDYGCGTMPYRPLFINATKYTGADVVQAVSENYIMINGDKLPVPDETVNGVVSFQVLEHIPSPSSYLQECYRILKPDGQILITTHGNWPYHPGVNNNDYWRWTLEGLKLLLEEQGFHVIALEPVCDGWPSLLQQILVMHDESRYQRNYFSSLLFRSFSLLVNVTGALVQRFGIKCDMLPVCCLVRAYKKG